MKYSDLRKKKEENFNKLASKLKGTATGKTFESKETLENGYWQPTADKSKAGYAVFRWMPGPPSDDPDGCALPYVTLYTHNFKGPGGWYIENCLTTLSTRDNPIVDPTVEYSTLIWGPKKEARSQAAKDRVSGTPGNPGTKRKHNIFSNIYMIDDPAKPECNGKVWKFKYGPKIFEFLNEAMNPSTADEAAWDPFDLYEGGNFKLKFKQVEGYRNYGQSTWMTKGEPLFEGTDADEKTDALYNSLPSLKAFVAPDQFKTYNQLKARLDKVLGESTASSAGNVEEQEVQADPENETPPWEAEVKAAVTKTKVKPVAEPEVEASGEDDEGGDPSNNIAFFESLRDK